MTFPCVGVATRGFFGRSAALGDKGMHAWLERESTGIVVVAELVEPGTCFPVARLSDTNDEPVAVTVSPVGVDQFEIVWTSTTGTFMRAVSADSGLPATPAIRLADASDFQTNLRWLVTNKGRILVHQPEYLGNGQWAHGSITRYNTELRETNRADPGLPGSNYDADIHQNLLGVVWSENGSTEPGGAAILDLDDLHVLHESLSVEKMLEPHVIDDGNQFFFTWWSNGAVRYLHAAAFSYDGAITRAPVTLGPGDTGTAVVTNGRIFIVYTAFTPSAFCLPEVHIAEIFDDGNSFALGSDLALGSAGQELFAYSATTDGTELQVTTTAEAYVITDLGVYTVCQSPVFYRLDDSLDILAEEIPLLSQAPSASVEDR